MQKSFQQIKLPHMSEEEIIDIDRVRASLLDSLQQQGFSLHDNKIVPLRKPTKDELRSYHAASVAHAIARSGPALRREPFY